MDGKQQKTEQDCGREEQGEARQLDSSVFEPSAANPGEMRSSDLMEEILDKENFKAAIAKVQRNGGAAGVDGLTTDSLVPYMIANWARIKRELLAGTYKPSPVKRVTIAKPGGGSRQLGIPTVMDRAIQQAFLQILQPQWDSTFCERSYGFRPGRSQHQAINAAQKLIQSGYEYVVDIDLEKFFDRVNHDILMSRVAKRVADKRVLKVIRAYLNAGILDGGLVKPAEEGVPQGGPLSPLLSNLMLDDLDKELERRDLQFVRFADDCNIYVKSERAGMRVKETITKFLAQKLRLKVNEEKSAVGKPSSRKFLGFTFGTNPSIPRLIAPSSLKRARAKVRTLVRKGKRTPLEPTATIVGKYLRGWLNYFGLTDRISDIVSIFGYARRRLRHLAWEHWRTPTRRRQELIRAGVKPGTAYAVSYSYAGAWRMSNTPSLNKALPNSYFRTLGFPVSLNGQSL
jgi:RNA-directed DNA polymerase